MKRKKEGKNGQKEIKEADEERKYKNEKIKKEEE